MKPGLTEDEDVAGYPSCALRSMPAPAAAAAAAGGSGCPLPARRLNYHRDLSPVLVGNEDHRPDCGRPRFSDPETGEVRTYRDRRGYTHTDVIVCKSSRCCHPACLSAWAWHAVGKICRRLRKNGIKHFAVAVFRLRVPELDPTLDADIIWPMTIRLRVAELLRDLGLSAVLVVHYSRGTYHVHAVIFGPAVDAVATGGPDDSRRIISVAARAEWRKCGWWIRFARGGGGKTFTGRAKDDIREHVRYLLVRRDGTPKAVVGVVGDTVRMPAYTDTGLRRKRQRMQNRTAPPWPMGSAKAHAKALAWGLLRISSTSES